MNLTDEQLAAATDPSRRVVVIAPPGSGKTATLAARVREVRAGNLVGSQALAVTFTNKAARELEERTDGKARASTFHGLAVQLKRLCESAPFTVYDETDRADVACTAGEDLGILKPGNYRDRRKASEKVLSDDAGRRAYTQAMRRYRAVDYDMLVDDAIGHARESEGLRRHFSSTHALIDETQDNDPKQWELLGLLQPPAVFVVGDPRQQIYGWRGGSATGLLRAWNDVAPDGSPRWGRHALTRNFRSVPGIVSLGNRIASGMPVEAPPMVASRLPLDAPAVLAGVTDSADEEADAVAGYILKSIDGWESGPPRAMVLVRQWRHLDRVRDALKAAGVPHLHLGERSNFWQAEPVKIAIRALGLAVNPANDLWTRQLAGWAGVPMVQVRRAQVAAARTGDPLAVVLRSLSGGSVPWLPALDGTTRASDAVGLVDASLRITDRYRTTGRTTKAELAEELRTRVLAWESEASDTSVRALLDHLATRSAQDEATESPVWLATVHAVKGLEAPHVAVVGMHQGGFSGSAEEDRRLWFVAATRARDSLLCMASGVPGAFWAEAMEESRGSGSDVSAS